MFVSVLFYKVGEDSNLMPRTIYIVYSSLLSYHSFWLGINYKILQPNGGWLSYNLFSYLYRNKSLKYLGHFWYAK